MCLGRDENGYPTKGIDLVPERPKPREPLNELITLLEQSNEQLTQLKQQADLVKLLQQANDREETLKHKVEHWYRKYNSLHSEYIALKYSDLCDTYQKEQTVESLKGDLIKAKEEGWYWQTSYETLLHHEWSGHDSLGRIKSTLEFSYQGKITESALLNKAGRLAAEQQLILEDKSIPDILAARMVKPMALQQGRLVKRVRTGTAQPYRLV